MMKDSEYIEHFLGFLREAALQSKQAVEDERRADAETQDILHRLELYEDNYYETTRLGKLLRQVRQQRRSAKEAHERLEPVVKWIQAHQSNIKELERLLGAVRKAEGLQANRMWAPRTNVLDAQDEHKPEKDKEGP